MTILIDNVKMTINQINRFNQAKRTKKLTRNRPDLMPTLQATEIVGNCAYTKEATLPDSIGFYQPAKPDRRYFLHISIAKSGMVSVMCTNRHGLPTCHTRELKQPLDVHTVDYTVVLLEMIREIDANY